MSFSVRVPYCPAYLSVDLIIQKRTFFSHFLCACVNITSPFTCDILNSGLLLVIILRLFFSTENIIHWAHSNPCLVLEFGTYCIIICKWSPFLQNPTESALIINLYTNSVNCHVPYVKSVNSSAQIYSFHNVAFSFHACKHFCTNEWKFKTFRV